MVEQETKATNDLRSNQASPAYRGESKSLFVSFLELFFSRWILISGIFLSASFWSYFTLMRAPDTFEATGQVMIRRGSIQAVRSEPILRHTEDVGSELDILLSITVLNETVDQLLAKAKATGRMDVGGQRLIFDSFESTRPETQLDISDLPTTDSAHLYRLLKNRVRTQKFGESNVIEVALVSANPRFAAAAVNTLIDVYEKYHLEVGQFSGQSAFFEREIDTVDHEINQLQTQLAELMKSKGIVDPDQERELLALRRHTLLLELDQLQIDRVAVRTDLARIHSSNELNAPFLRKDNGLQLIRNHLTALEGELSELRTRYRSDNPVVVAKTEEVEAMRESLRRERETVVAQQQHLLQQIEDKAGEIEQKIRSIDAQLLDFPEFEAQVDRLDRDIKHRTLKRVDMVEQMFKSSTFERTDQSLNKVRVLGYAEIPPFPREARKAFKFAVAVVMSLIAAFIAGVFVEGLDHTIRRRDEIESQLHVPYLASLSSHPR